MKNILSIISFLFLLTGCSNNFSTFYVASNSEKTFEQEAVLLKPEENPQIIEVFGSVHDAVQKWSSKNYIVLGHSLFNSSIQGNDLLIEQAKKVGATLVLFKRKYTNTEINSSYQTVPSTNTSTTKVRRSDGKYYTATNTYFTETMVPTIYNVKQYSHIAVFMAKSRQENFVGINLVPLTVEQTQKIGQNTGAMISVIIEKSPAFRANLLVGDVVTKIDGKLLMSSNSYLELLTELGIQGTLRFTVIRNGKILEIPVEIGK